MIITRSSNIHCSVCGRYYSTYFVCINSMKSITVVTVIIPILQTMKLRHREVKELGQGHVAGNDLEALQIHLCILASDFTIEGQPSLEAPLITVTRKLLPQQTEGKEEKTLITNAIFKKNTCFQKILKEIWKFFPLRRSFAGEWIWQAGSVKILKRFALPS